MRKKNLNNIYRLLVFILATAFLFLIASLLFVFVSKFKNIQEIRESKASATSLDFVPSDFNAVQTHIFYFPRDGEQYVGKRYFGTKLNAESEDRKFMKAWSGPLDCRNSLERQLVYHYYYGWDDKPGKIAEWEVWKRENNTLYTFRWGGPVANLNHPYWPCAWMNSYQPTNTKISPVKYNCHSGDPIPQKGMIWPSLSRGQSIAVYRQTNNPNTCFPDEDRNKYEYVAVAFRQNFDLPYSSFRKDICYRYFHPVWGRSSNAYNICIDAPYIGRFDQRYAFFDFQGDRKWFFGCEPVIYAWGYSENGPTHKSFRNGELRWGDYRTIFRGFDYKSYNDENFWQAGCDNVLISNGGWMYSGEYQIGFNLYIDKGDANNAPQTISRFTPNPTPTPISKDGTWYESKCGFSGEQWCNINSFCDTGWVGGPTKEVSCPPGFKIKNTGTYSYRWDGLKRFVGKTECVQVPQNECQ